MLLNEKSSLTTFSELATINADKNIICILWYAYIQR